MVYLLLQRQTDKRQWEKEDLGIFLMYVRNYKCTRILAKMRSSSELSVSFDRRAKRLDADLRLLSSTKEAPAPYFSNHINKMI